MPTRNVGEADAGLIPQCQHATVLRSQLIWVKRVKDNDLVKRQEMSKQVWLGVIFRCLCVSLREGW